MAPARQAPRELAPTRSGTGITRRFESHSVDELTWAVRGRAVVITADRRLIVTPGHAIYIPAGHSHDVSVPPGSSVRPLFLPTIQRLGGVAHQIARDEELDRLQEAMSCCQDPAELEERTRAFVEQMVRADRSGTPPMPSDPRAAAVARAVLHRPWEATSLADHARAARVSTRTLQRLFLTGTGLSFSQWRARTRLAAGVDALHTGATVTEAARGCGYTPSAFIARYRTCFGTTPGRDSRAA